MQFAKPEGQVQLRDNNRHFLYSNLSFKSLRADLQGLSCP